jgi:hypothetical protein
MTTGPAMLTSRTIGEAENALRAVLNKVLRGTDLDYHRWVALKLVAEQRPPLPETTAIERLRAGLKISRDVAVEVIEDLKAGGIVDAADHDLTVTADGDTLYRALNGEIRQLVQRMWAGLDVEDLVIAQHVLSTITQRANVLLKTAA